MYFELKKSINPFARQPYYFVMRSAKNGQVVMTSEMYANAQDRIDTINSIKRSFRAGPVAIK